MTQMLERRDVKGSMGKEGLEDLLHILGLSDSMIQLPLDVLLIALDMDGKWLSRTESRVYEVGFSILDTRCLSSIQHGVSPIETKHFIVGQGKSAVTNLPCCLLGIKT